MARIRGRKTTTKFSGGKIELVGDQELMRKIRELASQSTLNSICFEAMLRSSEPVRKYMDDFLDTHLKGKSLPWPYTQVTLPVGTGQSKSEFNRQPWWKNGRMSLMVGYRFEDYVKGDHSAQKALQALFLDIGTYTDEGTPRIKPTFFVYYGVRNSMSEIRSIQTDVLARRLSEIWNKEIVV